MKILLIAEHNNCDLKSAVSHAVTAAQKLNASIDVLVAGFNCQTIVDQVSRFSAVNRILCADHLSYEHHLAEAIAPLIADLAKDYQYIMAAATTFGKDVLPRAAALLDISMISDVIEIISADTFVRPIYAGNVLATVQTQETIKCLTIRTTAFAAASQGEIHTDKLVKLDQASQQTSTVFESAAMTNSSRPELTSARIVISGGRGLKSAENFKMLEDIADSLGAAIGASRAAVDAGFAPNDCQIGQTGKVVAPDLYIAIGISGAIQHVAGMKDSKVIVAINNDPDAPIFQMADYAYVGDLFAALPELKAALAK